MSSQTVARRYASALADVIIKQGEETEVKEELASWEKLILDNAGLLEAFSNPTIAYEQKGKLLNELIDRTRVRPTTANFLRLLLRNQRLPQLPQVNVRLAEVLDERAGVVSVQVKSARPLSEDTKTELQQKLTRLTGRRAQLKFETDSSLIGGIVTRIGSTIYDGSVRDQLRRLREELAG